MRREVGGPTLRRLAFLPVCLGWVAYSPSKWARNNEGYHDFDGTGPWLSPGTPFNLSGVVIRWDSPHDSDTVGLAGGISWAIAPDFCSAMIPRFKEEKFLGRSASFMVCDDLRAAISGAFSTWSANHRDLSFHDVSHACARAEDCEVAEVLISAESMSGEYADLAA